MMRQILAQEMQKALGVQQDCAVDVHGTVERSICVHGQAIGIQSFGVTAATKDV